MSIIPDLLSLGRDVINHNGDKTRARNESQCPSLLAVHSNFLHFFSCFQTRCVEKKRRRRRYKREMEEEEEGIVGV